MIRKNNWLEELLMNISGLDELQQDRFSGRSERSLEPNDYIFFHESHQGEEKVFEHEFVDVIIKFIRE